MAHTLSGRFADAGGEGLVFQQFHQSLGAFLGRRNQEATDAVIYLDTDAAGVAADDAGGRRGKAGLVSADRR